MSAVNFIKLYGLNPGHYKANIVKYCGFREVKFFSDLYH